MTSVCSACLSLSQINCHGKQQKNSDLAGRRYASGDLIWSFVNLVVLEFASRRHQGPLLARLMAASGSLQRFAVHPNGRRDPKRVIRKNKLSIST